MIIEKCDIAKERPDLALAETWKKVLSHVSAGLLGALFLVSGLWKILDLPAAAERMVQSLVPVTLSLPVAVLVAVTEVFAAILVLAPSFRRWGAVLSALVLIAFMGYIGIFYNRLLGDDCNCFPWIRRIVGPGFFAGDTAMLALAIVAGRWSAKPRGFRQAISVLGCVVFFTAGSYAISLARRSHAVVPTAVDGGGRVLPLHQGRVLLYFFDPECMHCYAVAREMAGRDWARTNVVVVPTAQPQFAGEFLKDSGLKAKISQDAALLRKTFPFTDPPYAVALIDGRQVAAFNSGQMEGETFLKSLKTLGFFR